MPWPILPPLSPLLWELEDSAAPGCSKYKILARFPPPHPVGRGPLPTHMQAGLSSSRALCNHRSLTGLGRTREAGPTALAGRPQHTPLPQAQAGRPPVAGAAGALSEGSFRAGTAAGQAGGRRSRPQAAEAHLVLLPGRAHGGKRTAQRQPQPPAAPSPLGRAPSRKAARHGTTLPSPLLRRASRSSRPSAPPLPSPPLRSAAAQA